MKKFMKTCGIFAAAMFVIGLVMVMIAGAVKGPEVLGAIGDYMEQLDSGVRFNLQSDMGFESDVPVLVGTSQKSFAATEVRKLDAEVGACQLTILPSEDQNIYVHTEGVGNFQCYTEDGTLCLKGSSTGSIGADLSKEEDGIDLNLQLSACNITLYVPLDFYFEEAKISLGAGAVSGSCPWKVGELELELAAGEITLSNVESATLNAEVGAGVLDYEGCISKEANVECGMGEVLVKLDDAQTDYNYDVEVAAGDVTIGSESFSGIAGERKIDNNAAKKIDIECAMGSVEVTFTDK